MYNKKTMEQFVKTIESIIKKYVDKDTNVTTQKITKNNGLILTGLIIKNNNSSIAPTIYLDDFYNDYCCGKPVADICKEILNIYKNSKKTCNFNVSTITDFEKIKNQICCKLINMEANKELLADVPHITIEDLAVIFYILVSNNEANLQTITIKNNISNYWNISINDLYELALNNTQRLFKKDIMHISNVIPNFQNDININDMPMFIVTNDKQINGAIVLFYDNLMKHFAETINDSFYILPSSVHETIFVPCSEPIEIEYIRNMVYDINRTGISREEYLSDNIYYYDINTGSFKTI